MRRDALIAEGGLEDAGGWLDGAPSDAALPMTDAGGPSCAAGACDPREPGSCSSGVCGLRDLLPACFPSAGRLGAGEACTEDAQCGETLACFADAIGVGTCAPVCCPGDDSTCEPGSHCGGSGRLASGVTTSWGRCLPPRPCDVLMPEGDCAEREGCYIVSASGDTDCRLAGTATLGEPCERAEDCVPGFFCAGVGSRACIRVCSLTDPATCPAREGECVAQRYSPPGTGVCVMPVSAR